MMRRLGDPFLLFIMRNITQRPNSPWNYGDLHNLKCEKGAAERKTKKYGLTVHKQIFYDKREAYREALTLLKKNIFNVQLKTVIKINSSVKLIL